MLNYLAFKNTVFIENHSVVTIGDVGITCSITDKHGIPMKTSYNSNYYSSSEL